MLIKGEHTTWVVKKLLGNKKQEVVDLIWTWMIFSHNSLEEAVVLVVDAAGDSISNKVQVDLAVDLEMKEVEEAVDNRKSYICSRTQMSSSLILVQYLNSTGEMKYGLFFSMKVVAKRQKNSRMNMSKSLKKCTVLCL